MTMVSLARDSLSLSHTHTHTQTHTQTHTHRHTHTLQRTQGEGKSAFRLPRPAVNSYSGASQGRRGAGVGVEGVKLDGSPE